MRFAEWTPPRCPGLFAILAADLNWSPRAFQPVYFGEFGNNAPHAALAAECSRIIPALPPVNGQTLFVAVLPMPFSTTGQRSALRSQLIAAYNPVYREDAAKAPPTDLARQVDELERKHREQLMLLIAGAEPPAPPTEPRRRIGFLPQTGPAGSAG